MVYMVVHSQGRATSAGSKVSEKSPRPLQRRWPLFISAAGAIGLSLTLWAGIFWLIAALLEQFGG